MNGVIIVGAMAFFGLVHSLSAGRGLRGWMRRVMGERVYNGTYRLLYNMVALLTLAPALLAVALLTDRPLYSLGLPWAALLVALQLAGLTGMAASLLMTNLLAFAGLRQFAALLAGDPLALPDSPLNTRGVYALVRHPLYFFSLLFLWATPLMTANFLLFNLGATAYFLLGTFPEERKLTLLYGDRYRRYQHRVPRLLPWPRPRTG